MKKRMLKNATVISTGNSKVKVYVIPTDEEIIIAKDTRELYTKSKIKCNNYQ